MMHPPIHIITKSIPLSVGPKSREVGSLVADASGNDPLILFIGRNSLRRAGLEEGLGGLRKK